MKRLTIVTTIAVALLMASPRPASAQFSAFMEWLNSLDPGGFWMYGFHYDFLCFGTAEERVGLSKPKETHIPSCKSPGVPERSRFVIGVDPSIGYGNRNLPPNPNGNLAAASVVGTAAVNLRWGFQLNGGAGFIRLWDSYAGTTNYLVRGGVGWSPVIAVKGTSTSGHTFFRNVQFRASATMFTREFQPTDFGAPPGNGFGRHEVVLTLGAYFGRF